MILARKLGDQERGNGCWRMEREGRSETSTQTPYNYATRNISLFSIRFRSIIRPWLRGTGRAHRVPRLRAISLGQEHLYPRITGTRAEHSNGLLPFDARRGGEIGRYYRRVHKVNDRRYDFRACANFIRYG